MKGLNLWKRYPKSFFTLGVDLKAGSPSCGSSVKGGLYGEQRKDVKLCEV